MNQTVFILGISRRSGTNFLHDLMCSHSSCGTVFPVREDFLISEAKQLRSYVDKVSGRWDPEWGGDAAVKSKLLQEIGAGINRFLRSLVRESWIDQEWPEVLASEQRFLKADPDVIVTKTPSVNGLDLREVIPDSKFVVIVRDGRTVTESMMKGLSGKFERTAQDWAASANEILAAKRANDDFLVVRYEDLLTDQRSELTKIFAFLGLNVEQYDFEGATDMPVRGSSFHRGAEGKVHWGHVEVTDKFKPLDRWRAWGRLKHERFNWIGAKQLSEFGYQPVTYSGMKPIFVAYNLFCDFAYSIRRMLKFVASRVS